MASGIQVYTRRFRKGSNTATETVAVAVVTASPPTTATGAPPTSSNKIQIAPTKVLSPVIEAADDSSGQNRQSVVVPAGRNAAEVVKPAVALVDDRVKINLKAVTSKNEKKELSKKLKTELDQVRVYVQKLEDKKADLTSYSTVTGAAGDGDGEAYSQSNHHSGNDTIHKRALLRINSEMGADYMNSRAVATVDSEIGSDVIIDRRALTRATSEVGLVANRDLTPFRKLTLAVTDNSRGVGGFVAKEKRTPKANQYYRNSEFLLGKDRLPSNKRPKTSGGWKLKESGKNKNQVFKSCSNLLQRLMKHKLGWVFNEPVNAKMLGLHDYHEIIKHPMDLGTIKSRLAQNFYKSPKEFAEDVKLTFRNAMTYNPRGQDVHVMAQQLLNVFEERWAVIESEHNPDLDTPTPTSRKVAHFTQAPLRTPVPKKPKAKDVKKRNMTYEEKQKLSANLQSLPLEKLDTIVQIIKKKTSLLSQRDGELEVDIDSVDVETLWELDRFFTNYKKGLSKRKRKAEISQKGKAENENPTTSVLEAAKENKSDQRTRDTTPDQGDGRGDNASRSSSSSSSSSDSGSTSSDSDSDSSSADGSPRS